jgi:hypothetical protein
MNWRVFLAITVLIAASNSVTALNMEEEYIKQTGNVQFFTGIEKSTSDPVVYVRPADDAYASWHGYPVLTSDSGFFNGDRFLPGEYIATFRGEKQGFHVDPGFTTRVTFPDYHPNTKLKTICSTLGEAYQYKLSSNGSWPHGIWFMILNANHESRVSNAIVITHFNSSPDTRTQVSNIVNPGYTTKWIDLPSEEIPSGYEVEFKADTCEQIPGLITVV